MFFVVGQLVHVVVTTGNTESVTVYITVARLYALINPSICRNICLCFVGLIQQVIRTPTFIAHLDVYIRGLV